MFDIVEIRIFQNITFAGMVRFKLDPAYKSTIFSVRIRSSNEKWYFEKKIFGQI